MRILVMALVLLSPGGVVAQSRPPVARADFTVATGAFGKRHEERPRDDRFTSTAVGELIGGLYWTDHLKTEMAVAWTGEASRFDQELLPGSLARLFYFENKYRSLVASAAQSYQFGRNAFFHPFVTAGIDVDRERYTKDRPAQSSFVGGPQPHTIVIPASKTTETRVQTRPFAGVGFKGYLSRGGFFRTDLKVGFAGGVEQITWRAGFGADF
jgi:hypothetical protein